ncbi:unnamed protein product [Victoria cruziana]
MFTFEFFWRPFVPVAFIVGEEITQTEVVMVDYSLNYPYADGLFCGCKPAVAKPMIFPPPCRPIHLLTFETNSSGLHGYLDEQTLFRYGQILATELHASQVMSS